ncbi:hypothetical protein VYU27_009948 [Nannochloropsis oceanica]
MPMEAIHRCKAPAANPSFVGGISRYSATYSTQANTSGQKAAAHRQQEKGRGEDEDAHDAACIETDPGGAAAFGGRPR